MVKLTIIGRVSDGLPLAQGPRYLNEENESLVSYKKQGEFILREISRGALPTSKMSIRVDQYHCFNYLVENAFCYITLCETSYPRKLAFHYLQDLQKEVGKLDIKLAEIIIRPYSFIRIDNVIGNVRKQYIDTRTQANLSKLNANRRQDLDVITEDISKIIENRQRSDMLQRESLAPHPVSSIWCSPLLEAIAMKWTPITILLFVVTVVLWNNSIIADC